MGHSSLRPWSSAGERWNGTGSRSKYLVSRVRGEWNVRLIDWGGICSIVDAIPVHSGEDRTEPQGKTSSASQLHLCSQTVCSDQKNKDAKTSDQNELTPQGGWAQPER